MAALPKLKDSIKIVSSGVTREGEIYNVIKQRQTEELVFAFCGPLGSGTSEVAKQFQETLKNYKLKFHCF